MWSCVWVVLPGVLRSCVLRQAPADRGLSTHRSPTGLPSPNWPVDPNMAIRSPFLFWLISYGLSRKLKRYSYLGFKIFVHGGIWHGIPKNISFVSFQHQSLTPRTLRKWLWVHRKVCIALVSTVLHIFVRVSARLRACACAGSTTGWGNTLGSRSEVRHRVHGRAADPHTEWPSTWHWNYRSPPWPGLDGNTTLAKPVPKLFSLISSSVPWLI